ncbi:hypothetical protein L1987_08542 [Smallanthus sonchifolius]|uniref:Uncharacterized protein n=1 Tax=Smallanthus sonchifolius TaxID=185202 RepID=A0ACB9JLG2_9ASTR|nr:hypothetical protein L1987_08542 [Smallanthus sonchifolius]
MAYSSFALSPLASPPAPPTSLAPSSPTALPPSISATPTDSFTASPNSASLNVTRSVAVVALAVAFVHKRWWRRRALALERPSRSKWFQDATVDVAQKIEKLNFDVVDNLSSESSSYCSNKVLDRYIDGEQQ